MGKIIFQTGVVREATPEEIASKKNEAARFAPKFAEGATAKVMDDKVYLQAWSRLEDGQVIDKGEYPCLKTKVGNATEYIALSSLVKKSTKDFVGTEAETTKGMSDIHAVWAWVEGGTKNKVLTFHRTSYYPYKNRKGTLCVWSED